MSKNKGLISMLPLAAAGLAALLLAGTATAQVDPGPGYAADSQGDIVRDSQGDCVLTSAWSEANAIEPCHPELVAARDAPLVVETEPEPAPAQIATAPVRQRITLDADTYFEFDQAELTQAGRDQLNRIAEAAASAEDPSIQITGYADPIGPEQYNLDLSERRAESVKAYLVERGVPEGRVQTSGQGTINVVPQCEGMRGDALIECLAPNRRADVEFAGFEIVEQPVQQAPGAMPGETTPGQTPR